MKRLLGLFVILFSFLGAAAQELRYVNVDRLNLREEASSTSTSLLLLERGTEVTIVEEGADNWCQVEVNGQTGYVYCPLLAITSAEASNSAAGTATPSYAPAKAKRVAQETVYLCDSRSAYAYHSSTSCRGLNRCSHGVISVSKGDAQGSYGRSACKICY